METSRDEKSQQRLVWIVYVLHILVFPAALGALINALKLREYGKSPSTEDTQVGDSTKFFVSHHQWLLRTFLVSLFFLAIGLGTLYYGVGYIVGIGAVIWWIYRMVRGIIGYAEKKPMPV
jgi:uncharacterized membrane protein